MANEKIINFYVLRIKNGDTELESVPTAIKEQVLEQLDNQSN